MREINFYMRIFWSLKINVGVEGQLWGYEVTFLNTTQLAG